MAKVIELQGEVVFPAVCAVCLQPAAQYYTLERIFSYGSESVQARVDVPMCPRHLAVALRQSKPERLLKRLGLWLGLALGLVVWLGLVLYWQAGGEGSLVPNIFLGLVVGTGIFLIFWSSTSFWLAPRLADRDSQRVREAVRILRYWPGDDLMELEVQNERLADMLAAMPSATPNPPQPDGKAEFTETMRKHD
jgi:hypothetical protein